MSLDCVLLSGGVGGAKLALGMSRTIAPEALAVVVNTGDDFRHLGLAISPDLDTLMYTLAGCVNAETGWGRAQETWECLETIDQLGGDSWFRLGDRDLAVHLLRTEGLATGQRLTRITAELCVAFGVETHVLPITDESIATQVHTTEGVLSFQEYFVRRRAEPGVQRIDITGTASASPTPEVLAALTDPALQAILIAPSNPYLSIDPMLAVPGLQDALRAAPVPIIAVSPIVAGQALKGPTAKIMLELGQEASAIAVARHYQPLIDGFILDTMDAKLHSEVEALGLRAHCCNTIMTNLAERTALAREALDFAARCPRRLHS